MKKARWLCLETMARSSPLSSTSAVVSYPPDPLPASCHSRPAPGKKAQLAPVLPHRSLQGPTPHSDKWQGPHPLILFILASPAPSLSAALGHVPHTARLRPGPSACLCTHVLPRSPAAPSLVSKVSSWATSQVRFPAHLHRWPPTPHSAENSLAFFSPSSFSPLVLTISQHHV